MPELPEVETVRRALLGQAISGRRIRAVALRRGDLREKISLAELDQAATGRLLLDLRRRGKYIIFRLDGPQWLLSHLGMTGSWRICPPEEAWRKHEHLQLVLEDGRALRYEDPRRFGLLRPITAWSDAEPEPPPLAGLGVEPLEPGFTPALLFAATRASRKPMKTFLLDGLCVTGVGNIYCSEALFAARLHPLRPACEISRPAAGRLHQAIVSILERAINCGGTTISDFKAPDGSEGRFEMELSAYGRAGQPCVRCHQPLERLLIAGRSTFFCRRCQAAPA